MKETQRATDLYQIKGDTQAVPGKAVALALRDDQTTGPIRKLNSEGLLFYNTVLADKGKEAADKWLTEHWQ